MSCTSAEHFYRQNIMIIDNNIMKTVNNDFDLIRDLLIRTIVSLICFFLSFHHHHPLLSLLPPPPPLFSLYSPYT